jgi:hypothetical protein
MEMRRQQAIQRKADEEKAKAMEEERKMKEESERRKREKEDQTYKQPFKPTTSKRVSCITLMFFLANCDVGRRHKEKKS